MQGEAKNFLRAAWAALVIGGGWESAIKGIGHMVVGKFQADGVGQSEHK